MASFAHLAYVLERAADIMLGDHTLNSGDALRRAIWGGQLISRADLEMDMWYVASRIVEIQHCETTGADPAHVQVGGIPQMEARNAARHMAELFHRLDFGGERPGVEDDDPIEVARLMWEQAHGVELARCP